MICTQNQVPPPKQRSTICLSGNQLHSLKQITANCDTKKATEQGDKISQFSPQRYCFIKVICQISRSHGTKKRWFWPIGRFQTETPVWIARWLLNDAQSLQKHRNGVRLFFMVTHYISRCMNIILEVSNKSQWVNYRNGKFYLIRYPCKICKRSLCKAIYEKYHFVLRIRSNLLHTYFALDVFNFCSTGLLKLNINL